MSVDVAFESGEEIVRKLARYDKLFKNRYTDADAGYKRCVANAEKVRQVPVIDPWPPRGVFSHRGRFNKRDDWDGGGGGRRRGHRGRRRDRYHRDPYSRYPDDRPPPPGPWGYGPRSPRDDYRDRSPHRPLSPRPHHYHRHGSSSPLPYPPPSHLSPHPHHHPSHLSPHPHHPHHHHHHHRSPRSRSVSPAPVPHSRSPHRSPHRDRDSESTSGHEAPPTVPRLLNLDLDEKDERIPSESDVQDILSFAHAPPSQVTAENLRQAKMEGRKIHRSKQDASRTGKKLAGSGHDGGKIQDSAAPSGQGLLITHGKTEVVSTSYLLGNQEEEEEEGRRGIPQKKIKRTRMKRGSRTDSDEERQGGKTGGFFTRGAEGSERGLVMRLDKKFCHSSSESSILSHSVPNTPSSDLTPTFSHQTSLSQPHLPDLKFASSKLPGSGLAPPTARRSLPPTPTSPAPLATSSPPPTELTREKKRKKKKKKKKKSSADKEEEEVREEGTVTVAPLKLKISLGKSH